MRKLSPQSIELVTSKTFFYSRLHYYKDHLKYSLPSDNIDDIFNYQSKDFYKGFSQSDLLLYFKELGVDTPHALNAVVSYHRTAFKTRLVRFNNYMQRSGKKLKFILVLLEAYSTLVKNYKVSLLPVKSSSYNWRELSFLINYYLWEKSSTQILSLPSPHPTSFSFMLNKFNLIKEADLTPDSLLFDNLLKLDILFSFYIYKVDKHLFKNSRGKSGKFTFIWKYVPPYKRFNLISHWFMRELRITPGKTLNIRLVNLLTTFLTNFNNSWLWKVKKFSAVFVYSNLRNSLAQTYRVSRKSR